MTHKIAIAVFAHNEQEKIETSLSKLITSGIEASIPIHVLANGCRDKTEEIIKQFSIDNPQVKLHVIEIGDKANAWNYYVHVIREDADVHCFADGDIEVLPGAFAALTSAFKASEEIRATTALPASGRHQQSWTHALETIGGIAGNLYALDGKFIERIRTMPVRIPTGTIGEDGFVGAMAYFDLDPAQGWNTRRIALVKDARFFFESLDWRKPADIRLYIRRRIRYATREIQNQILKRHIKAKGFANLPEHINETYATYPEQLKARWRGCDTIFHLLARRKIMQKIKPSARGT